MSIATLASFDDSALYAIHSTAQGEQVDSSKSRIRINKHFTPLTTRPTPAIEGS